ncbi:hypothetical protein BDV96DRAFT_490919 [Lophiotrema nucula]|uniref:WDR59/RTC1-like RING zinc finger domain-containing protein n=1 Tax=Lophiotrema nucula TaxID=690887 RepID=A0A6A5ZB44_9PLEO|nr:hypothetical protein BDV96DRAFT_490919 [Lophiotrema nucula]
MATTAQHVGPSSAFESSTFDKDVSIYVNENISAASISPSGRDVVLASEGGLLIIDLDNPYSPPRHIVNRSPWMVADVQWSPFASRAGWIVSTSNQKAIVYNLNLNTAPRAPIQYTLHAHDRAITDINFSAHEPDVLATCSVDSFVYTWDLRGPERYATHLQDPKAKLADFEAGASQVKWNRGNQNIIASSHNRVLRIWDLRHGARPLTTVDAHDTQIYGIDWHRSDPTKILTCSLDKTIKLWDKVGIDSNINHPCRMIRSNYPLWRARHTPFTNGILAMPQRGSSALELYTHDAGVPEDTTIATKPAHHFTAHDKESRVQEFLWRSRGTTEGDIENREFQLVSWGTDRTLRLHSISPDLLSSKVGFVKGGPVLEKPSLTRRGAPYFTFRDGLPHVQKTPRKSIVLDQTQQKGHLSTLLRGIGSAYTDTTYGPSTIGPLSGERTTMTAGTVRRNATRRIMNHITWMEGVTIGKERRKIVRDSLASDDESVQSMRGDLAEEISHAGNRFNKVSFEHIDVRGRRVTVSFNGPWGDAETAEDKSGQKKLAFVRLNIGFPDAYPTVTEYCDTEGELHVQPNPLTIEFEKTTAAIREETLATLKEDMKWIANNHAKLGREALEAIIGYGVGERSLEESITIPKDQDEDHELSDVAAESSSDDDDIGDEEGQDVMNSSASNAAMPLPRRSSSQFSAMGLLVVVRIATAKSANLSGAAPLRLANFPLPGNSKNDIFEAFGRFTGTHDKDSDDENASPTSSPGSWYSSSSPSSDSGFESEIGAPLGNFQPPLAWQKATLRFEAKTSHPSSVSAVKPTKEKSVVSVLSSAIEEFIPSKKYLADEYRIFGDGPTVCSHNAKVARRHGLEDVGDVWDLCGLILKNEVPLEILPQTYRREPVLVLARRALVRIKRKDSGLDLQFDEADTVTNPKLTGRIKWGHHPVVSFLIPSLFDHFEKLADTQMLAMLSCIFSEPAAREGPTTALAKMRQSKLPMSMEAPAFSLDYFPSADAAWSMYKPTISIPSTPAHSRYTTPTHEFGWNRFSKGFDTYGSHGSSNGPWGSDNANSEPVTPYSTGNTPPNLSRVPTLRSMISQTTSNTPYSTSPEDRPTMKKAPSTNFASALASFSRPFANAMSSSPPVKTRIDGDLSTSAPSGVTWGTTTFFSSGSNERSLAAPRSKHGKRASFGQSDRVNVDYYSDTDSEYDEGGYGQDGASEYTAPLTPAIDGDEVGAIKVTLKNQDRFDDESCVSAPLLDLSKEWLYRAWREQYAEMLGSWGLVNKRAEVLKFNGLVSYFPPSASNSKPSSIHLVLKGDSSGNTSGLTSAPMSRTSTLVPPEKASFFRKSPAHSPRYFSFNPEATEFTPSSLTSPELGAVQPALDVFSSERHLQLSFPTPVPTIEEPGDIVTAAAKGFDTLDSGKLKPRPSISRTHSDVSRRSIGDTNAIQKKQNSIYTCSICWLRVLGRVYLCPSCRHVAHFDCIPDPSSSLAFGIEDGDCVVGCGCGCGLEQEQDGMDPIDKFRAWEEKGGWLPEGEEDGDGSNLPTPYGFEGGYGDGIGNWMEKVERRSEEKRKGKRRM